MTDKDEKAQAPATEVTAPASKPDTRLDEILELLRKPAAAQEPDARLDEVLELLTKPAGNAKPDLRIEDLAQRLDNTEALLLVIARHVTGNLSAETPEDFLA